MISTMLLALLYLEAHLKKLMIEEVTTAGILIRGVVGTTKEVILRMMTLHLKTWTRIFIGLKIADTPVTITEKIINKITEEAENTREA
jgi:Cdc6-like AAA superfamily ATPase